MFSVLTFPLSVDEVNKSTEFAFAIVHIMFTFAFMFGDIGEVFVHHLSRDECTQLVPGWFLATGFWEYHSFPFMPDHIRVQAGQVVMPMEGT